MKMNLEIMAVGALISVGVHWFVRTHMQKTPEDGPRLPVKFSHGLRYALILVWEVVKANAAVFRIIVSRTIVVEPCLVYFRTDLMTNAARVALANSITLTPGTITVDLTEGLFCVHCLDKSMAVDLNESVFVKQLRVMEQAAGLHGGLCSP